jgi:hypothetical protein
MHIPLSGERAVAALMERLLHVGKLKEMRSLMVARVFCIQLYSQMGSEDSTSILVGPLVLWKA